MRTVFTIEDADHARLTVELDDQARNALVTCDRPGERAVSHALTAQEFEAMVTAVRAHTRQVDA